MAKSSKFLRLDSDVLLEFIYHDQSNPTASTIETDNNGSHIKFLNTIAGDNSATRYLINELGDDVSNFTVTTTGKYITVNAFSKRELQVQNGKTYEFDLTALTSPLTFTVSGGGSFTNTGNGFATYTPNTNGNFTYSYTDLNGIVYEGGNIIVSDKANPLFSVPVQETGNTIKTGVGEVGRYYAVSNNTDGTNYALLDNPLTYLDTPFWQGTTSANLQNETIASNLVNYDTVRLHLKTGFSFSTRGYEGFLFQVRAKRNSGVYNYFTSLAYLNFSNFEVQNPTPFVLGDTSYSKFIEVKVPSIVDMYDPALNLDFQNAFFGTGQNAINPSTNYEIVFKLIDEVYESSGVKFINSSEILTVSIPQEDEYQDISGVIEEATDGDYFNIYGLKDGSIDNFAKYINLRHQTSGDDITVFHDIEVLEQYGNTFTQTSIITYAQTDNFDKPIMFRPIIKNAGLSNSFLINYNLRIYNETDNTQIVKQSSLIYNKPSKYAKRMVRLNTTAETTRVYNKIASNSSTRSIDSFINSVRPSVGETKYVPVAVDTMNIVTANTNVQLDGANVIATGEMFYYGMNEGIMTLSKVSDNFIKFRIAKKAGDTMKEVSLVNAETVELIIKSGAITHTVYADPSFPNVDMGKGEVLFKIDKSVASKFDQPETNLNLDTFYINLKNGSTSSMLYYGKVNIV